MRYKLVKKSIKWQIIMGQKSKIPEKLAFLEYAQEYKFDMYKVCCDLYFIWKPQQFPIQWHQNHNSEMIRLKIFRKAHEIRWKVRQQKR